MRGPGRQPTSNQQTGKAEERRTQCTSPEIGHREPVCCDRRWEHRVVGHNRSVSECEEREPIDSGAESRKASTGSMGHGARARASSRRWSPAHPVASPRRRQGRLSHAHAHCTTQAASGTPLRACPPEGGGAARRAPRGQRLACGSRPLDRGLRLSGHGAFGGSQPPWHPNRRRFGLRLRSRSARSRLDRLRARREARDGRRRGVLPRG